MAIGLSKKRCPLIGPLPAYLVPPLLFAAYLGCAITMNYGRYPSSALFRRCELTCAGDMDKVSDCKIWTHSLSRYT